MILVPGSSHIPWNFLSDNIGKGIFFPNEATSGGHIDKFRMEAGCKEDQVLLRIMELLITVPGPPGGRGVESVGTRRQHVEASLIFPPDLAV